VVQAEALANNIETPHLSEFQRMRRVFFGRPVVVFGMAIIFIVVILAIVAPWIAPYNPYQQNLDQTLLQPSQQHLLGTDSLGRDTFSRIIYGSRNSLMVGIVALGIAASIGMTIGLIAGYFGGWIDNILMRFVDALMCFPMILLALVIAILLGNGLKNVMIALGVAMLPGY
jgi:ABC-type dipeptide/oligopeptide/nickel transport system permease subunit